MQIASRRRKPRPCIRSNPNPLSLTFIILNIDSHLVAPKQTFAFAVLPSIPGIEELGDTVVSDVFRKRLCFRPVKRGAYCEETHRGWKVVGGAPGLPTAVLAVSVSETFGISRLESVLNPRDCILSRQGVEHGWTKISAQLKFLI